MARDFTQFYESRLRAMKTHIATTPYIELGAAGGVKARLQNPTGSGKKLFVTRIDLDLDGANNGWGKIFWNATTNLPTVAGTIQNLAGGTASVAAVYGDISAGAISGGTILRFFQAKPSTYSLEAPDGIFCLPADKNLVLTVNFPAAVNFAAAFYFFEENA